MDDAVRQLIDRAKEISVSGKLIEREMIVSLLAIDPDSEECEYLGKAAREAATVLVENKARVGTSIGLDLCPCAASCEFCSLGAKWGLIKECAEISDDTVLKIIREKRKLGYYQFTLRTTEYYSLDRLCELGKRVRREIPGDYLLSANTGELTLEDARHLKESGFTSVYHVPRLGEGKYTPFTVEERIQTMMNAKKGGLILSTGLDPIGIEFTDEELADKIIELRNCEPAGICVMKRESVPGTPLGNMEEISESRHAQIVAVVRLSTKGSVAIHPVSQKGFDYGANNAAAEIGATPRQDSDNLSDWIYRHDDVYAMMSKAGYEMVMKP